MDVWETRLETRSDSTTLLQKQRADSTHSYEWVKRALDIVLSIIGLLLLSPLFVLIAIAIKMEDSRGTILFRQTRIGMNGKPFAMYKFRSMVRGAETMLDGLLHQNEISGAMFKMKRDPRVTKVGRWIRKASIDEFPQFINVLRGEMSLVGPRPPLPREVKEYTPYQMNRLSVMPGCTGLWQISGRNELSFEQMVELDLKYIATRSFLLDLKIMWQTVVMLLLSKNGF